MGTGVSMNPERNHWNETAATAAGTPAAIAHHPGANVVVLSADPTLVDLLRDALAGVHRIWRADDAAHAVDLIVAASGAVLLLDAALADQDTRALVERLTAQFPDLAIIVAGRREDEAGLAPLISDGAIFRFLHKPASAERIRNFVEATQRRAQQRMERQAAAHQDTDADTIRLPQLKLPRLALDPAAIRRWSRRSLLLLPVVAVAWLVAEWQPWSRLADALPDAGSLAAAPAAPGESARVLKLLDAAGVALSQGRLIDPPERNALELYRAVLERDPGNEAARQGILRVADGLLAEAEQALIRQDLPRLAATIDAARSVRADHPRLEFFTVQLARERERLAGSEQLLRAAASAGQAADASAAQSAAGRVQGLVQLANERISGNRLVGGTDSAQAYLLAARRLDPADTGVRQGMTALGAMLESNARQAIAQGRLDDAGQWLQHAVELDADRARIAQLRSDLEAARLGSAREDRARLLALANQRIAQGRLAEPAADSARHYLDLLRAADPNHAGLAETSALLASRSLAEARRLAAAGQGPAAEAMLSIATGAGAARADVAAVAALVAAPAAAAPTVIPESQLRRTRFTAPRYPEQARRRDAEGWVDVEFTVARDGTTRDARVVAAEPASLFDSATLDAIARWRYEPRIVDGKPVDQRVSMRLRFTLED